MTGLAFVVFMLVFIDQMFKTWAYNVTVEGPLHIIPGIFQISYVENTGAAFSILQDARWLLVGVTSVMLAVIGYLVFARKVTEDTLVSGLSMILAGGLGNLIDRIMRGFVVDCLDFSALFGFPVFNFADICVTVGTAMLLWYLCIEEPRKKKEQVPAQGKEG